MKLVKLYESVLMENEAQACVAKFGEILFADQLGGNEKNTGEENNHVKAVRNFTDFDFGENIKPEIEKAIIQLKHCMTTYPEVLKPNPQKVYRGTSAPLIGFIRDGRLPTKDEPVPYTYKAHSLVQSWSEDWDAAMKFGDGEDINDLSKSIEATKFMYDHISLNEFIPELMRVRVPIIMEYRATPKDFLFKGEYLNMLSEFDDEDEVIRVENKPISVNAYMNTAYMSYKTGSLLKIINEKL